MTSLMRLYPRDWRERYEDEFLTLLAERPPDVRDRVDIVRGAVDARLRPQVAKRVVDPAPETPSASLSSRALGSVVLLGGVLWFVALALMATGPIVVDAGGSYRDGMAAVPVAFAAFVIAGVGVIKLATGLPRDADGGRVGAGVAAFFSALWAPMPWVFPLLIIATIGWLAFAVSARRAGVIGRGDAAVLVGGLAVAWVCVAVGMLGIGAGSDPDFDPAYGGFFVAMASVWISIGHALLVGARWSAAEEPVAGG